MNSRLDEINNRSAEIAAMFPYSVFANETNELVGYILILSGEVKHLQAELCDACEAFSDATGHGWEDCVQCNRHGQPQNAAEERGERGMMERLTKRDINGIAHIEFGYNEAAANMQAIQRLAAYEDAEEEGRVEIKPCKVGDTVYKIQYYGVLSDGSKRCHIVQTVCNIRWAVNSGISLRIVERPYNKSDILQLGKTVFLTCAEAEAALEALKENSHE